MDKTDDKRRFHRILYSAEARLSGPDNFSLPCKIVDLSLKGCLLHFDEPWTAASDDILYTKVSGFILRRN